MYVYPLYALVLGKSLAFNFNCVMCTYILSTVYMYVYVYICTYIVIINVCTCIYIALIYNEFIIHVVYMKYMCTIHVKNYAFKRNFQI